MATDDEFAAMVSGGEQKPPSGPRVSEWPGVRDDLAALIDRVGGLTQAVIASAGQKPPKIRPYPRPWVAGERIRERRRKATYEALMARWAPKEE